MHKDIYCTSAFIVIYYIIIINKAIFNFQISIPTNTNISIILKNGLKYDHVTL